MSAGAPLPARAPLAMIAAIAHDRVIGNENALPWHHPEDLEHFKRETLGHAVISGRKTHDSVGRPLPKRRNIVVSRDPNYLAPGCEVVASPEEAVRLARQSDPCPFVLGGETLYRALLPQATLILLTEIDERHPGDTFFPELDLTEWQLTERRPGQSPALTFLRYERRS